MRIEAAEMLFLRWVAGYTLIDRRRSEETRRKLRCAASVKQLNSRVENG